MRSTTYHCESVVNGPLEEALNKTRHEVIQVLDRQPPLAGFTIIQRSRRWFDPDLQEHPPADPNDRSQWYDE